MRHFLLSGCLIPSVLGLAGCTTGSMSGLDGASEAETAGLTQRLGAALGSACGENRDCTATAARFAGFLWEYRESFSVQARVYRCVGQYAVQQGYGWGARRFVDEMADEEEATGMAAYLYECAVPGWARNWFDDGAEPGEAPVPPEDVTDPPAARQAAIVPPPSGSGLDMTSVARASRLLRPNEPISAEVP